MINGILLLDKPTGISSHSALQKVRRLLSIKKAGHAGTLDPLATGMLPIAFNEATKFLQYGLEADKTYSVTMKLGERTNTSDSEGEIISTRTVPSLSFEKINEVLDVFRGDILQKPSMFSALKHNGVPLYEYARKGIEIDRPARPIRIDDIKIISIENNFISLVVRCSKGTYIRTLVDDVGEKLECGAHVAQLRRLSVGNFLENQMHTLENLAQDFDAQKNILPIDVFMQHLPICQLPEKHVYSIKQGQSITLENLSDNGFVRLYDQNHIFFGVAEVLDNGKVAPRRLIKNDTCSLE